MVSRVTPVIAKDAADILRVIFRWRDVVSQFRVTIFLISCFLLGMVVKPLPVKGQMGTFKPSITLSNLALSIALICQSVQALNSFVSEFALLTRKCE